ncbi:MAG: hypothetical protein KDK41_02070 [Leptospiraceae bacterium]|nr:hypothetical protein [Leptospiraceae bacterium]MCB1199405.1 hypothetical protein [Leptospiraceae bacterium]
MKDDQELDMESAGGIETQLDLLYAEKEELDRELGFSSASEIIETIRSLEEQLNDLYQEKESSSRLSQGNLEIQIEGDKLIVYGPSSVQIRKRKVSK